MTKRSRDFKVVIVGISQYLPLDESFNTPFSSPPKALREEASKLTFFYHVNKKGPLPQVLSKETFISFRGKNCIDELPLIYTKRI